MPRATACLRLVSLCAVTVTGWESRHISVSSGAFDPAVVASCAGDAVPPAPPSAAGASSEATVCEARFQWVVTEHVEDRLRARLDVGGEGVPAGWLVGLDFGAGATVSVSSLVRRPPGTEPSEWRVARLCA